MLCTHTKTSVPHVMVSLSVHWTKDGTLTSAILWHVIGKILGSEFCLSGAEGLLHSTNTPRIPLTHH